MSGREGWQPHPRELGSLALWQLAERQPVDRNIGKVVISCERAADLTRKSPAYDCAQTPNSRAVDINGVVEVSAQLIERACRDDVKRRIRLPLDARRVRGATIGERPVTDEGDGNDEEARARAFEPFFGSKGEPGTGLGLWTVDCGWDRHRRGPLECH